MSYKISRVSLVIVTVITLAYWLPESYNTVTLTATSFPSVTYSFKKNKFFLRRYDPYTQITHIIDCLGNKYDEDDFLQATPVSSYYYLQAKGKQPESVVGDYAIDEKQLREKRDRARFFSRNLDAPSYGLFPLFEARAGVRLPDDFCRITNSGVEFIDAKTNQLNQHKSDRFTEAFTHVGFHFPAKIISGIPTIMKNYDNGYFLTDQNNVLFHYMMIDGDPFIQRITTPDDLIIKQINASDIPSREIHAYLVSSDNKLYILSQLNYMLTELPVYDYDPQKHHSLWIEKTAFYLTLHMFSGDEMRVYAIDRNYKDILHSYVEQRKPQTEHVSGKISWVIFPFRLTFSRITNNYVQFIFSGYHGKSWLVINFALVGLFLLLKRKKSKDVFMHAFDCMVIMLSGILGLLAVLLFPNKKY